MIGLGVAVAVDGPGGRVRLRSAALGLVVAARRAPARRTPPGTSSRGSRPRTGAPVAGTHCPTFPADNYWHADIRHAAGRRAQQAVAVPHVADRSTCTPTSGRRSATGPTTASRSPSSGSAHPRVRVHFHVRRARATTCATRWARDTRIEGGRKSSGDRHAIVVDKGTLPALRDLRDPRARRPLARPAPARSGRSTSDKLRHERLDVRRRRRPADPARPAALERGQEPRRRPRHPLHHRRHLDAPPVAGPARRRLAEQLGLPADGGPLPAARVVPPVRASDRRPWRS